jgi:hypothetical protein
LAEENAEPADFIAAKAAFNAPDDVDRFQSACKMRYGHGAQPRTPDAREEAM